MVATDSVCIVGAGPAGLVTAKVFMDDGYDVTIYEKYDEVGGTWSSYRRYVNLNHQLDRGIFEFSDMPNDGGFQDAEEIQRYLEEYADRFGVCEHIEFETEVVSMETDDGGWAVELRREGADETEVARFDYAVVCSGMHHYPKVPDIPDIDAFDGEVLHSSEVDREAALEGKDVVLIGGGKSAHDLAVEAAELAASATMVFRRANWMTPKKLLGGRLPHRFILYSRFGESILPEYYNDDCVRLIDRLPGVVKDALWTVVTRDMIGSAGLDGVDDDLVPDTELRHHITHAGVIPDGFARHVESGAISPVHGTVERADADGMYLSTGEYVEADVVVLATGFRKEVPFFDADVDLKVDDDRFYLYRSIVPPGLDTVGFIGTRQTFNNLLSMEISAHWLSAYFREELVEMPSEAEMCETIDERLDWQEREMPNTEGFDFGPYDLHCVDELLLDMGVSTDRANPITEYFMPRASARYYADLGAERKRANGARAETDGGSPGRSITSAIPFL